MAKKSKNISVYISFLLRHHPEVVGLQMDCHGWVNVQELIHGINGSGIYTITQDQLERIVAQDRKGRYRFSDDGKRIKACQGHSITWVEPELTYLKPPMYLYHGTTLEAWESIKLTGGLKKMERHAVHMQAEESKAWQSAKRWHKTPVVLKIWALEMHQDGYVFGKSDNDVWCIEHVPLKYIKSKITLQGEIKES